MLELAVSLVISTTTAPRQNQIPPGWEIPCAIGFSLGVLFSRGGKPSGASSHNNEVGNVSAPTSPNILSINTDYDHYLENGKQIIGGFAVSDRSQMIVAPSRCGKTTVMYFLLDEFFKRHPEMDCWVWQGKTIEPVHPKIPRCRHTLFQMEEPDLTAIDKVYEIYRARSDGDSNRTLTKLVITDWQSIKDGLCATNPSTFKEVAAKIITLANNGAALNVTVTGDTQSAAIDDWGLGSGSLRDNFDIYAVSRIEWVDGYAKGDIKALPKLIGNDDIVVSQIDRKNLLSAFELLKTWMEEKLITSSVLLSTVGSCLLGVTPFFDRTLLTWETSEKSETPKNFFQEPKQPTKQDYSDSPKQSEMNPKQVAVEVTALENDFASEPTYTYLNLPKTLILAILQQMQSETGVGQTKIIRMLWGVKPGDNEAYKNAVSEYKQLTSEL